MKRILTTVASLMLCTTAFAGQLIIGSVNPGKHTDIFPSSDYEVASVGFTLDTSCAILITTGGNWYMSEPENWIKINGEIEPLTKLNFACSRTYLTRLPAGYHRIGLFGKTSAGEEWYLEDIYLQVLIFTPEENSAVSELPNTSDPDPVRPRCVLASGMSVKIDGCQFVYDLSGQKVNCQILGGEVMVNTLPAGTYIAKSVDGTTTKIVKVN